MARVGASRAWARSGASMDRRRSRTDACTSGATDGKVYSYGATSGELRWSHQTGGYVYASPAVWRDRVFIGSYDRHFYALDAATGAVVWEFAAGGRISGSATVVGGRVYFSTLEGQTYALDASTGARTWSFPDGEYTPVIADKHHLYVVGKASVYALVSRARIRSMTAISLGQRSFGVVIPPLPAHPGLPT